MSATLKRNGSGRATTALGALAGAVLSALLYSGSFPPLQYSLVAWIALVPLFVAARSGGAGLAALSGFVWAELAAFLLLDTLPASVATYFRRSSPIAWTFCAVAFALNAGIYYGAALALYRALATRFARLLPLLAGAGWVTAELARGRLLNGTGFVGTPIGMVAYSQMDWPAAVQIAELTGPYGISFAVVAFNAAIAELWLAHRDRRHLGASLRGLGLAAIPGFAALAYGFAVLPGADAGGADASEVPVVVVQGDIDPESRWNARSHVANLDRYTKLTRMAVRVQPPELVFWPEAAITFDLDSEPELRDLLSGLLTASGAELILGAPRLHDQDTSRGTNSVFAFSPGGDILGRYDKQYLLPFAEFAPLGWPDLRDQRFGPVRFWERGEEVAPLPTRAGPAGVLVCNEVMLPEVAARRVGAGATYLVTPANDGWLGGPNWGRIVLDMARLRAIEQRRYVVRPSTAGPSAVIDPMGVVRAKTLPGTSAVLVGAIRPRGQRTAYARVGDLFAVACAGATLAALVLGGGARRTTLPL